jgi:predicted GIY-YIG superfamily endonuclease
MHYVYLIRSVSHPQETYVGMTSNLRDRLKKHNSGGSVHTSKFIPWGLVTYCAFSSKEQAADFEKYLKSGSGRAFALKRLW